MGIRYRYFFALLIFFSLSSTAATKYGVPGIKQALATGPSGIMPSGLTVQRSQQLSVMLLKSNLQLAIGNTKLPVTRGASLSVSGIAKGVVSALKANPAKMVGGALLTGAIAQLPGASFDPVTGQPLRLPSDIQPTGSYYKWVSIYGTVNPRPYGSARLACIGSIADIRVTEFELRNNDSECWSRTTLSICPSCTWDRQSYIVRTDLDCPNGFDPLNLSCNTQPLLPVPFSDSDYSDLEDAIVSSNPSPDDVKSGWFQICNGDGGCMSGYVSDPTLTGPASLQKDRKTTTSTGPNGTTTKEETTYWDFEYDPDGVTARERKETRTTNPDGSTTTSTELDLGDPVLIEPGTEPGTEPDFDGDYQDSEFPEVEPFYEQQYEDGLEGVWDDRKSDFEDSAFISFLESFIPNFSGSCPSFSLNFDMGISSFGTHTFDVPCSVYEFIGIVILLTAVFTCRAIMFGG